MSQPTLEPLKAIRKGEQSGRIDIRSGLLSSC